MKIGSYIPWLITSTSWLVSINAFTTIQTIPPILRTNQQPTLQNNNLGSIQQQQQQQQQFNHRITTKASMTSSSKLQAQNDDKQPSVVDKLYEESSSLSMNNEMKLPTRQDEIRQETDNALSSVGWSMPMDGDLSSDDPFVQAIDESIQKDFGVPLDELLNPAKVVNLERDLYVYRTQLAGLTGKTVPDGIQFLNTIDCDGGGGGDDAAKLRSTISKKEADLIIERRSVFRGWLKNIFLGQAILSFGLSYVMATNPQQLFGSFDWFYSYNMDISISVLGYWWWWLFVVPSLRSRRPKGIEKKALDIAFIGTPLISLIAPVVTKDTGLIWDANLVVVLASYAFAVVSNDGDDENNNNDDDSKTPAWLKFIYKSLDFGSGRERGARQ
jgi:hypothetical protein